MEKKYLVIFKGEDFELHKKVKALALVIDETMNDFIIQAIRDRIKKVEARQK